MSDFRAMRLPRNKRLVVGVVVLVLLGGGAGALAATQLSSSNPQRAYLNDVASRLHVTPAALISAMKQATIDRIDAAQKAGRLTAAEASAAKSRIENGRGAGGLGLGLLFAAPRLAPGGFGPLGMKFGTRGVGPGPLGMLFAPNGFGRGRFAPGGPGFGPRVGPAMGFGFGFGPAAFALGGSAVTGYLGITATKLRSDLAAGKSLAQIASATAGKSVAGLESALTAAARTRLDKAVAAGFISSTREHELLAAMSARLSTLVHRSF